jgi:nitrogen regulatory protein P-II 1
MAKLITAVIQPQRFEIVRQALEDSGISRMTLSEAAGFGRQKGHTEVYRGHEHQVNLVNKTRLEVLVPDDEAQNAVNVIVVAARTGTIGDGKVWITPVDDVVRVRTGDRGDDAI